MAEQEGYIKVDRNMLHWRWMAEPLTAHLFIYLLLKANYKNLDFRGKTIPKGSLVTSYQTLCKSTGLSLQQCRTALKRLKSTGEITIESTNQYQVITIVNYKQYQEPTSKLTFKQQATNKQLTNEQQQVKNIKKVNKGRNIPPKSPTGGLDPSDRPERGTDAFRNKSHLLLKEDEGTADDIPVRYREMCDNNFSVYWRYRNQ